MTVEFRADISEFDHGIDGIDNSDPETFLKSMSDLDITVAEASQQVLHDKIAGKVEDEILPTNINIVERGISSWGYSIMEAARRIARLPNGLKTETQLLVPKPTYIEKEDISDIVDFAEEDTVVMQDMLPQSSDDDDGGPRYVESGNPISAGRAKRQLMGNVFGRIKSKFKIIAVHDADMLRETAQELKDRIDKLVSNYT